MQVGQTCPEGFLPVYSVDDEKTARLLVVMACPRGTDGEYYARELFDEMGEPYEGLERIEAFNEFGWRLKELHERLEENRWVDV